MYERLKNARVLVIGGSSGIAEATAALALDSGAHVTIASRSHDKLQAALQRLSTGASASVLDVIDALAVEAFFAQQEAIHQR